MTPAGFPHSDIHGSKPACGSPWLFAAYHVFLRRPVPWHPPCALSNLIVTNLSSCQRIDFSIFVSLFLLRPTAKLSHFHALCSDLHHRFATGFFTRCFPSGCAVFKVHSGFSALLSLCFRSLKTIQVQEEEQSSACSIDRNLFLPCRLSLFLSTCCAPNNSLTRFRFLLVVSTWCQA